MSTVKEFTKVDYKGKKFKLVLRAADMWSGVQKLDDCRTVIYPPIDKFGRTVTGLEDDEETRLRLENELGLEPNSLKYTSKFWNDFSIQLDGKGLSLDTTDPMQELQYLFLNKIKIVAKSLRVVPPNAVAILFCEEDEAKVSNVKRKSKVDAFKKFAVMSTEDMKKVLTMYGKRGVDSMSNEVIQDILGSEVELNPTKFLDIANDPNLEKKMFITALLNKGIVKKIGARYMYGETTMGTDLDSVVTFLTDKVNQPILLALKEMIK
jgi:hypothetical protein